MTVKRNPTDKQFSAVSFLFFFLHYEMRTMILLFFSSIDFFISYNNKKKLTARVCVYEVKKNVYCAWRNKNLDKKRHSYRISEEKKTFFFFFFLNIIRKKKNRKPNKVFFLLWCLLLYKFKWSQYVWHPTFTAWISIIRKRDL